MADESWVSDSWMKFFLLRVHRFWLTRLVAGEIESSVGANDDYIFAAMFLKLFKLLMIRISSINNCFIIIALNRSFISNTFESGRQ